MLPAMKGVKLLGLSSKISSLVESLRTKEVALGSRLRQLQSLAIVNGIC